MSSGETHEEYNRIAAFIISLILTALGLPLYIIIFLDYGLVILSLWYSCDLDKENSRPVKRWWIFKSIFRTFWKAGHREVLHDFLWGPIILCVIPVLMMLPYVWYSRDFRVLWILVGLVISIWIHILTDKISGVERWKLFKILKKTTGYLKVTRFWGKSKSSRKAGRGLREY